MRSVVIWGCVLAMAVPAQAGPSEPVGAWRLHGKPARYTGKRIYDYMDGAAEVHRMYGFRSLVVWSYRRGDGATIKVERFDLGTAEGAFGDFTHARDIEGEAVDVGQDGHYQSGVLWFWKGRHLVCLSSRRKGIGKPQLLPVAQAIAATVGKRGRRPDLVRLLPRQGLRKATVRYFRTPAALNYHYGGFPHAKLLDLGQHAEAVLADYKRQAGPSVLLIARYTRRQDGDAVVARLRTKMGRGIRRGGGGKWRGLAAWGNMVRIVLEAPTRAEAGKLLRR